jgi:hypothetical protein
MRFCAPAGDCREAGGNSRSVQQPDPAKRRARPFDRPAPVQAHAPLRRKTEGLLSQSLETCAASVLKHGTYGLFVPSVVSRPTGPTGSFSIAYTEIPEKPGKAAKPSHQHSEYSPSVFNISSHSPPNPRNRSSILRVGQVRSLPPRRHPCPLKVNLKPTAVPPRTPPALPLSQARPPPP